MNSNILKSSILAVSLIVGFSLSAEAQISQATYNDLNSKNFVAAQTSIQNDIASDQYDAQSWYFYSRILLLNNQPNAAKNALNNALNIDKTGSFAKGGMSAVKSLAHDIMGKMKTVSNEKSVSMVKITAQSYHAYLNSIFGSNNPFSNTNPPTAQQLANAIANKGSSRAPTPHVNNSSTGVLPSVSTSTEESSGQTHSYSSSLSDHTSYNAHKEEAKKSTSHVFLIVLIFVFLVIIGIAFFLRKKSKNTQSDEAVSFFNKVSEFSKKVEDKETSISVMAQNSALHQKVSGLSTRVLSFMNSIDLNSEPTYNQKSTFSSFEDEFAEISTAYNFQDFTLSEHNKKVDEEEKVRATRAARQSEEERQDRIRREQNEYNLERERIRAEGNRPYNDGGNYGGSRGGSGFDAGGFLTGMAVGSMLESGHDREGDRTTIINETVNEAPEREAPQSERWDDRDNNNDVWNEPAESPSTWNNDDDNSNVWDNDDSSDNNNDDVWDDNNNNDDDDDDSSQW